MSQTQEAVPVAVLICDDSAVLYELLTGVVAAIRGLGIPVGGLLQRRGAVQSNGKGSLWLEDLLTGRSLRLDEDRGSAATACVVDTDALAQAAAMVRNAIDTGVHIVIVNRFGSFEVQGGGLRAEIADALCLGAGVLIPVRRARLPDLEAFLGAPPAVLPPEAGAIVAWAEQVSVA